MSPVQPRKGPFLAAVCTYVDIPFIISNVAVHFVMGWQKVCCPWVEGQDITVDCNKGALYGPSIWAGPILPQSACVLMLQMEPRLQTQALGSAAPYVRNVRWERGIQMGFY